MRQSEDITNEKRILETKLRNLDATLRSQSEEFRNIKNAHN